jgi:polysaccharide export outer membrane protein
MRITRIDMQRFIALLVISICILLFAPILGGSMICAARTRQQLRDQSEPSVQTISRPDMASALIEPEEDYRIGSGDLIEIQVDRAPELSGTFRVTASGTLPLAYLGSVIARERTTEELSNFIANGLRGRYLTNPKVRVAVKQINSHAFFIQGTVRLPGVYQIEGRPSLLKLITIAGGLANNHGSTAYIIRGIKPQSPIVEGNEARSIAGSKPSSAAVANPRSPVPEPANEEDTRYELTTININGLLKGVFNQNMFVEPGDIINIPPADVFFVAGEVQAPGSFPLKEGTTLRQAISLAQGTTFNAIASRGIIYREDPATGKRQELKVDVSAVMAGKTEDVAIMANDIIMVPHSRFKSVGSALLTAFGLNAARYPRRY